MKGKSQLSLSINQNGDYTKQHRWFQAVLPGVHVYQRCYPGRPISGGSVLNGQVQDAEEALALQFRMKIQFLGSHTITLPVIQASSTQKPEMP